MIDGDDGLDGAAHATDTGFRPLLETLSEIYNFDFREYKEASLARRIRVRMAQVRVDSFEAYARFLEQHHGEHVALFNTILINVTGFFRDPDAWQILGAEVLPRLVKAAEESRSLRVWSVGCSSGEEPYSFAILLAEYLGERASEFAIKIYGTDVDEDALANARHAAYRVDQLKDVPDALLERHFARDGQLYRVRRELRRWCIFGSHNVMHAPPLSQIDLLICRNVMIYFSSDLQERILSRFHYAVREDGFLFLGRAESLLARSRLFTPLHPKWRIFVRTAGLARGASPTGAERPADGVEGAARPELTNGARAQRALEALPAALIVIDPEDTIVGWNPAAEQLFDIPVANALGRKFRDLDVSYRVEGLRARVEEVKTRHVPVHVEDTTFSRRTGELVHADIDIVPVLESFRIVGVLVYATEATEQAALREQMSRISEQHATAIEELQSTNEELETTNEELQSTNEELETTNEELQSTNEELETTVEELQAANSELAALNAELERRTAELNRLDVHHHALLNSLGQAVLVFDSAGTVRSWNQTAERLFGVRTQDAVGRDFFTLPIGDVTRITRPPAERVLSGGPPEDVRDVPYTMPDSEPRTTTMRLTALRDGNGGVLGVVATLQP